MKTFFSLLGLFFALQAWGQKINDGYIVTADNDTLRGKLNITVNSKVKLKSTQSSSSFAKLDLKDYGEVKSGQWVSYFAKTAFPHQCRRAILYPNGGDSTAVYLYKQGDFKINYYDQQNQKVKSKVTEIDAYKVQTKDGNWVWYDRVAVPTSRTGMLGEVKVEKQKKKKRGFRNQLAFGKRLSTGKINLFSTTTMTTAPNTMFAPNTVTVSKNQTPVYLLVKGKEKEILPKGKLQIKFAGPIKILMADYPALSEKIGTKGYKLKDIEKIVEEYNQYWLDLEG